MITKEEGIFKKEIEKIGKNLELEKYSNTISDHNANLNKFLKKYYTDLNIT
jgi:hypothetical protein